jgi:fatty acid desaturase
VSAQREATQYRVMRRVMMLVALVALLAMTAGYGVFVGMALVIAFVCGTAFASLNYLEDEAKGAEK